MMMAELRGSQTTYVQLQLVACDPKEPGLKKVLLVMGEGQGKRNLIPALAPYNIATDIKERLGKHLSRELMARIAPLDGCTVVSMDFHLTRRPISCRNLEVQRSLEKLLDGSFEREKKKARAMLLFGRVQEIDAEIRAAREAIEYHANVVKCLQTRWLYTSIGASRVNASVPFTNLIPVTVQRRIGLFATKPS